MTTKTIETEEAVPALEPVLSPQELRALLATAQDGGPATTATARYWRCWRPQARAWARFSGYVGRTCGSGTTTPYPSG